MSKWAEQNQASTDTSESDRFVRETIEKLRLRLLDLTTRNPLISFKHPSRSRRYVRVIDELPDQLFAKLSGDSGMRFRSLGRKANEPEDEKTILFRRALEAAKLEDTEYQEKLKELGDDPGERVLERLEQELRQRLRERLGMSPRTTSSELSPADVALQRGLDPSFDLPVSPASSLPNKHADSTIQTLLFEEDMQLTLGRMREAVRLSIDETGVNPLFCVFGFLEWYEDTNSETPLYAPILLCPLKIDRKLARGQYQYTVLSTGEETQLNVALSERLKRDFDISLPLLEEDDTPEKYFTKIQGVIEQQKSWKVRRWITTGLFSFARIAMYRDLSPDRWESLGGLEKHVGLNRLIAGGGDGQSGSFLGVDGDEQAHMAELEIPLVADADSSQLTTIKDVLSGRSLVIEGPPGTGKSQTITNIIAASLAAGKSVLFLAEKMAALNVVRKNLVEAGLADFCMELHSTKAGRKEAIAAIARRLEKGTRPKVESDLQAVLSRLQTLRDGLGRCVDALAQPVGNLGLTIQELLWRCHAVRQETMALPSEIDEISLPDADVLTEIDVGRIVSVAEQFERARHAIVESYGSVRQHPWHGVARHDIDPIRAEDIVRRVRRLFEASTRACQVLQAVAALTGISLQKLTDLERVSALSSIPEPDQAFADDIIARMAEPQTLAAMEHFVVELKEYRTLCESSALAFENPDAMRSVSVNELQSIADNAIGAGIGNAKVSELRPLVLKRQQQAAAWQAVAELMSSISIRAGWTLSPTPAMERSLIAAAELAAEADSEMIAKRSPSIMSVGSTNTLRQAILQAKQIKQQREALASKYELNAVDDPKALRQHALIIRSMSFSSFLSSSWWRAKRTFRGLSKTGVKVSRKEMAKALEDVANFSEASNAWCTDEGLQACVGKSVLTIDTDLTPLQRISEWADRIRSRLPAGDDVNNHLRTLLLEGTPDQLQALAASTNDAQFANLKKVVIDPVRPRSVDAQAKIMASASARIEQVLSAIVRLCLKADVKLADCADLARTFGRSVELRESLDTSVIATKTLGDRFKGHESRREDVLVCTKHVRAVVDAGLPIPVRDWLLGSSAKSRLASLRSLSDECSRAAVDIHAAVAELNRIATINFSDWIGSNSPIETCASELATHTERCANDADGFQLLINDCRLLEEIREIGMQPLLELLESRNIPMKGLGSAAKRIIFQSMARSVLSQQPALLSFTGDGHEARRREFKELDHRLKRYRQGAIANALARKQVDPGAHTGPKKSWTGFSLIQNEVSKQSGHIPLRDLLDRAGSAVQQLMPCFMMSPLSIAQFLKPSGLKFDLIVMDEASQLRPEDALGAIARGAQLVVVGDPKQLPPTNFFRGSDGVADDDDSQNAPDVSILDQALTIMRPARRLKWHYRSRHPSLIAYSNKEFYENQLILFPVPYQNHPDYGVKYVYVSEGQYRGSVNLPEVQHIAAAAIEYVSKHLDRSLGIITLNQAQAELLSLEIDRLAAENEEFEAWRQKREQSLEPFFVKNLENVQGDERDAIFISTVYGPDEPGKKEFPQRFGPINNSGGERRLNVLFTRAKCQSIIFSSMDPADIRTDETSSWGLRALKGYMKFAKDGELDIAQESGRAPDSDFEVAVADVLKSHGFEVVPQVGVVGYFIDLAVRHPQRPGEFVLGIECDGAMYHSSHSARDRDRLRQEVLERLKWRIHRIWSLDWYRNSRRESERLFKAVTESIAAYS